MKILNSLYIHFPFCRHLCNYCDFYKTIPQNGSEINSFHKLFEDSFEKHQNLMESNSFTWAPLETLYIGGGTPSLWGAEGAIWLRNFLNSKEIKFSDDLEFTLEVNPGSWTVESLEEWKKTGVNRYSLGIQSLDGRFIKHLDRVHSIEDTFATLEYFKNKNYNFSVDFMLGIPFSVASIHRSYPKLGPPLVVIRCLEMASTHFKGLCKKTKEGIRKQGTPK